MLGYMQSALAQLRRSNTGVAPELWDRLANPQNLLQPSTRAEIPVDLLAQLIPALADSLWYAFLTGFALMIIGIVAAGFMAGYTPATTPRPAAQSGVQSLGLTLDARLKTPDR
jgi:ABC-type dipeptide/oligopeptide/nickel transport system permease subunit